MSEGWNTKRVYAVSEITAKSRLLIEDRFPLIWVEGEVSNFRRPGSGHWYFSLKDDRAQLRCAMFASRNRNIRASIQDGMHAVIRGHLSLYEGRGDFQAIVDHIEPAGEGELRAAFDRLKATLEKEGLFATAVKRPLPTFPRHIGIISSTSGAAIHDVLAVLRRRFPCTEVTCFPVAVQGINAGTDIVNALDQAESLSAPPDVIVITRGGGSLEDLMAFNLESVARRIYHSKIPIVAGVGHETDVTIADFVADQRAPTPSAAAELITPNRAELILRIKSLEGTLIGRSLSRVASENRILESIKRRVVHPARLLEQQLQRADDQYERLRKAVMDQHSRLSARLTSSYRVLDQLSPRGQLERSRTRVDRVTKDLIDAIRRRVERNTSRLRGLVRTMNTLSPLDTLERGYAIVSKINGTRWGRVITEVDDLRSGEHIQAHLASGTIEATVDRIKHK
jgi:exodeoxyribonuclease VII large subunit